MLGFIVFPKVSPCSCIVHVDDVCPGERRDIVLPRPDTLRHRLPGHGAQPDAVGEVALPTRGEAAAPRREWRRRALRGAPHQHGVAAEAEGTLLELESLFRFEMILLASVGESSLTIDIGRLSVKTCSPNLSICDDSRGATALEVLGGRFLPIIVKKLHSLGELPPLDICFSQVFQNHLWSRDAGRSL